MKRISGVLIAFVFFAFSATAQQQPASAKQTTPITNGCIMKGGKMMRYQNGKETLITKPMTMNGMTMMPDGTCKMKNGNIVKLKEGQCCDSTGMVHNDCAKLMKKH